MGKTVQSSMFQSHKQDFKKSKPLANYIETSHVSVKDQRLFMEATIRE
jgi:hypothetical protein